MGARVLVTLVVLAVVAPALAAQAEGTVDVHVLTLVTDSGALLPEPRIAMSRRLSTDPSIAPSRVSAGGGDTPIAIELATDQRSGQLVLHRDLGRGRHTVRDLQRRAFDVQDPFRFSRRPRRSSYTRSAVILDVVADPGVAFQPMDVRAFFQRAWQVLLEPGRAPMVAGAQRAIAEALPPDAIIAERFSLGFDSPRWKAALLLGAVPIEDHLEPHQVDRILDEGAKVPRHLDDDHWPFLRPLVALGDEATLRALASRGLESNGGGKVALVPHVPRSLQDSVLVAYASATDPKTRGLAAWVASGTRHPMVLDTLARDIASGRAVLPGTESEQAVLHAHILSTQAWNSVRAPALTLAAGALVIAIVLWILRSLVRGWF